MRRVVRVIALGLAVVSAISLYGVAAGTDRAWEFKKSIRWTGKRQVLMALLENGSERPILWGTLDHIVELRVYGGVANLIWRSESQYDQDMNQCMFGAGQAAR